MKYIKRFESMSIISDDKRQEILQNLEDMSLELQDEDFKINFSLEDYDYQRLISVCIIKRPEVTSDFSYITKRFIYNNVKDFLLSMISYIESEGLSIESIQSTAEDFYNYIGVELRGEELYLKSNKSKLDYPIYELVIKFRI